MLYKNWNCRFTAKKKKRKEKRCLCKHYWFYYHAMQQKKPFYTVKWFSKIVINQILFEYFFFTSKYYFSLPSFLILWVTYFFFRIICWYLLAIFSSIMVRNLSNWPGILVGTSSVSELSLEESINIPKWNSHTVRGEKSCQDMVITANSEVFPLIKNHQTPSHSEYFTLTCPWCTLESLGSTSGLL